MKFLWASSLFFFATSCLCQDDGGRDVTVTLFSTRSIRSATITPLSTNAWTASCATCAHQALRHSLIITGRTEIFASGTLRIEDSESHATRTATGLWHLRANAATQDVDIVLTLPSERYVTAVLNAEASPNEPAQSLQALAIVARTYALNGHHSEHRDGHLSADFCDSTACQAMLLQPPTQAVEDAARRTAGETLWFGSRRADVFFSQSCGGLTEDAGALWSNLVGKPYLRSHPDPFCLRKNRDAWNAQVPLTSFTALARREGWHLPTELTAARVIQRTASQRALRIQLSGPNGETAVISASALRFGIGRALGWNRVRSDAYELGIRNGALIFDGHGHGHGVGLCQSGATEMASEGKSASDILAFYFPGTAIRISPQDAGWHENHTESLIIRTTTTPLTGQQSDLQRLWMDAQRRFPLHHPIVSTIIFAPSTEIFRQLSNQPGWMLASTSGTVVILQPDAVLRAHRRNEQATVLHEMLHVAIESECLPATPLWLREGLTEVLAGEKASTPLLLSTEQIETELHQPSSQAANERAHLAASTKVKALIARYGLTSVRSWLSSGIPAGVA
jgi:stage II sporulation protein D